MTSNPDAAPPVLLHHFKHNKVLHEQVVCLSIMTLHVPEVPGSKRLDLLHDLGEGVWQARACYGFMQAPNVPEVMQRCRERGLVTKKKTTRAFSRTRDARHHGQKEKGNGALEKNSLRVSLTQRASRECVFPDSAEPRRGVRRANRALDASGERFAERRESEFEIRSEQFLREDPLSGEKNFGGFAERGVKRE